MMRRCVAPGFSLMEVMVVLVIIALTLTLAYPSISRVMEKAKLDSAAREVASVLSIARQKASGEQKFMAVVIRPHESDITVFDSKTIVLRYRLWEKAKFSRLVLDGQEIAEERAVVWFYPDGRSTGLAMIIRHESGGQVRLKTSLLTGVTQVLSPTDPGYKDEAFS